MVDYPSTSLTLLERAQAGEPRAREDLYKLYIKLMYYWCRKLFGLTEIDTEEICSRVMVKVLAELPTFEHPGKKGAFRGWLKVITRHEICDFSKEGAREISTGEVLPDPQLDDPQVLDEEKRIKFHTAWSIIREHFTDRDQRIFWRKYVGEEKAKDIAEDLGMPSTSSVEKVVQRIKQTVRERFNGEVEL